MDYNKVIEIKSKFVLMLLTFSIAIRIVIDVFINEPLTSVLYMIAAGIVFIGTGMIIVKKKFIKASMYYMVGAITGICNVMMLTCPSLANLILFYYCL